MYNILRSGQEDQLGWAQISVLTKSSMNPNPVRVGGSTERSKIPSPHVRSYDSCAGSNGIISLLRRIAKLSRISHNTLLMVEDTGMELLYETASVGAVILGHVSNVSWYLI